MRMQILGAPIFNWLLILSLSTSLNAQGKDPLNLDQVESERFSESVLRIKFIDNNGKETYFVDFEVPELKPASIKETTNHVEMYQSNLKSNSPTIQENCTETKVTFQK